MQQALNKLDDLQRDIDYDVGLGIVYGKWRDYSTLVTHCSYGEVAVDNFYYSVLKNSGISDYRSSTKMDDMLMKKLISISIPVYDVAVEQMEDEDFVRVKIVLQMRFSPNSMVTELNYEFEGYIDCQEAVIDPVIKSNHKMSIQLRSGFFCDIKEDYEMFIRFVNEILPYAYEYHKKLIPPLIFDDEEQYN